MLLKSVLLENFRGIERLELQLDRTTVLIGENNTGKTSILESISLCLGRSGFRRAAPFDEYDYHLPSKDADPSKAPPIKITLTYVEEKEDDWPEPVLQALEKAVQARDDKLSQVRIQFTSRYDAKIKEYVYDWTFLDLKDQPLPAPTRRFLSELQQLFPVFLLAALRDAGQQFQPRSPFWASFIRNLQLDDKTRLEIEKQIEEINQAVLDAHKPFEEVKEKLSKAAGLVPLFPKDGVSVEAVPARVYDILSRTQVKLAATTGARLPLGEHGAGTQSLAVVLLFEAFLNAKLADDYDEHSEAFLALEEPETHLHPSAIRSLWSTLEGLKGQKLIATHSGDLLSAVPLTSLRRLARKNGKIQAFSIAPKALSAEEERQLAYTIRAHRGSFLFARCWLLVEGASEFWFLPAAARYHKVDLEREGIVVIEYAQLKGKCVPLIKLANALGIEWHLLADGDDEGKKSCAEAKDLLMGCPEADRITQLGEKNLEHCLWPHGYANVYESALQKGHRANIKCKKGDPEYQAAVLSTLGNQKPGLAVAVGEALQDMKSPGLPKSIVTVLECAKKLAQR